MKNKTQLCTRALIPNFRYIATPLAVGICLAHSATAAITTWTGASDDNWSSAGNWDTGLPSTNDVVFAAADATGTTGPSGTVNNIVDATTTIASLKYTNLQTGNHTTRIPTGVTLTVNGAGTNIEVQSPTSGPSDVVYATIHGDGTLAVNNTAATLLVTQGSATANTTRRATLDLSGLETFSATLGGIRVGIQSPNARPQGTLKLARNNTLNLSSTPGILVADASGNGGNSSILELGTTNTIRSSSGITVGGRKTSGILQYNSTVTSGTANFRDLNGTGRQAKWLIGDNSATSGTNSSTGLVDFSTKGSVDALVTDISLGRGNGGGSGTGLGTLTFDSGTIDTNSLSAGIQSVATSQVSRGIVNVNGTATLRVNGNVTLARDLNTAANIYAEGAINIGGGAVTIAGDVICGLADATPATAGSKISLTTGSLTLGGKVGDDSILGDAPLRALELGTVAGGAAGSRLLKFNFGSAPNPTVPRVKVTNLTVPHPVTVSFTGTALTSALPDIPLIKYTTFDQATQFANLSLVDLPMRVNAALVNNVANSSVDLDIISASFNKWSGATNGDWDINTTVNWLLDPVNTASTYIQPQIPGEPVTFDDSASGTKTVNLTTALSPSAITVNTAATYTFNGAGKISGPATITKQGSGSLVIQNAGTNDFTGVINVEAGTLKLGPNTPLGSTAAGTTVASGGVLDLNGQTVGAEAITLNGTGIGSMGALVNTSASAASLSSVLTLSDNTSIGGTGSITLGNIAQSGANRILTKVGPGTLTLDGTISYTGGTVASEGTLVLNNPAAFGAEKVTLAGGTISSNVNAGLGSTSNSNLALFIDAASTIDVAADKTVTINRINSSAPSAANVLNKTGPGTLRITGGGGNGNVFGGYKANAGTLFFNTGANSLAGSGTIILDGGNATFTKNLSSQGVYNPYDLTLGLQVLQDATITQDAGFNDISPPGSNTLSFTSLTAGTSTLQIVKGPNALSSANPGTFYTSYTDPLVTFFGGTLSGNLTLNVGLNIGASLRGATGIGGLTKTGPGRLILADNAATLTPNSYSGPTIISTGTLALSGTHASAISVEAGATLEFTLNDGLSPIATSTAALTLDSGSTVSIVGTPVAASYTLASTAAPIGGTPVLSPLVPGYELVVDGNLLKLNSTTVTTPFSNWVSLNTLVGMDALPGTDVENDGLSNLLEFVLVGDPKANDTPSVRPRIEDGPSAITLRFKRSNDSELQPVTVKVQVSANLGVWNPADDILIGAGNGTGPNGATYTVTPNGAFDDIVVTIPKNSATVKFARVQAVMP